MQQALDRSVSKILNPRTKNILSMSQLISDYVLSNELVSDVCLHRPLQQPSMHLLDCFYITIETTSSTSSMPPLLKHHCCCCQRNILLQICVESNDLVQVCVDSTDLFRICKEEKKFGDDLQYLDFGGLFSFVEKIDGICDYKGFLWLWFCILIIVCVVSSSKVLREFIW